MNLGANTNISNFKYSRRVILFQRECTLTHISDPESSQAKKILVMERNILYYLAHFVISTITLEIEARVDEKRTTMMAKPKAKQLKLLKCKEKENMYEEEE